MKVVDYDVPLDHTQVELIGDKACKFTFTRTGLSLTLKLPNCVPSCVKCVCVDGVTYVRLSTLKKWVHKVRPIYHTWLNFVRKYSAGHTYYYQVEPVYKHFPIVLNVQNDVVSVYNYLGLKKRFYVKFESVRNVHVANKKLYVESYNDILTGSNIDMLRAIRYKTHHKNLDRRIFTDGFVVKKSVEPFDGS